MSNLKLFQMYTGCVTANVIPTPGWERLGLLNATIYFHPEPATHGFVGELFLKNYNINFIPFTAKVLIPRDKTVYFLVRREPTGLWDRRDNTRWAIPAKGTKAT